MSEGLRTQRGGSGTPTLLLIHGLGATGDVWDGVSRLWPGRWLAPDLPGHGGSGRLDRYTFDAFTTAVARTAGDDDPVVVVGHSLGGVVGLHLAGGRFGVEVTAVIGIGIKVAWTVEDLAKAAALARRPVTWFDTRDAAADRYLRISGLTGLVQPTDPIVDHGISQHEGRWRLSVDPATFAVGAPDMPRLLADARSTVVLARGERDPLVTDEQLAALSVEPVTLPGLGHNAHVQDPGAVLSLLDRVRA